MKTWLFLIVAFIVASGFMGCPSRTTPPNTAHFADGGSVFVWLAAMAIIGVGASVAAAVFLPAKTLWTSIAAGFATILGIALVVHAAWPYLIWVAIAVAVTAIGFAIWYFRRYVLATHAAVAFGCDMACANSESEAQAVIDAHKESQESLGIRGLIDQTICKVKDATSRR